MTGAEVMFAAAALPDAALTGMGWLIGHRNPKAVKGLAVRLDNICNTVLMACNMHA